MSSTKSKNTQQGAATSVYAALSPDIEGGGYYSDCQLEKKWVHHMSDNVELAGKLFNVSVELAQKAGVDVTRP